MCDLSLHGGNRQAQCFSTASHGFSGLCLPKSVWLYRLRYTFRDKGRRCAGQVAFLQLVFGSVRSRSRLAGVFLVPARRFEQNQAHSPDNRAASSHPPAKMNPLAVLPTPVTRVSKQNTVRSMVVPPTIAQRSLAHRKTTAPCQSRFRPVTLVSSRTRFGPSK